MNNNLFKYVLLISILALNTLSYSHAENIAIKLSGKFFLRTVDRSVSDSKSMVYQVNLANDTTQISIISDNVTRITRMLGYDNSKSIIIIHKSKDEKYQFQRINKKIRNIEDLDLQLDNTIQNLVLSPDNGKLVLEDIFASMTLAPDENRLVFSFSPEGKRDEHNSSLNEIYVYNIFLKQLVRVTNNANNNRRPAWSPDGKKIAFFSMASTLFDHDRFPKNTPGFSLMVMDSDGKKLREIAPPGYLVNPYSTEPPIWSPNGNKILFTAKYDLDGVSGIYCVDVDGSNLKSLKQKGYMPAWSPDGSKITFIRNRNIYVMNSNGTHEVQVTNEPNIYMYPKWSSDGDYILFLSDKKKKNKTISYFSLFDVKSDGSTIEEIVPQFSIVDYRDIIWANN